MSSVNLKRQKQLNAEIGQVMDDFDRFEYAFVTHWKKIVTAAVLVVVAVAVIVSAKVYANYRQNSAAAAFSQAVTAEALEKALSEHSHASAAVAARLRLAGLYINAKNYDGARRELQTVSADKSMPELAWRASLNLGYLAELEGKIDEAAEIFAVFSRIEVPGSEGYRAESCANAGRLFLKAGKKAEAKEILESGMLLASGTGAAAQAAAVWAQQIAFLQAELAADNSAVPAAK